MKKILIAVLFLSACSHFQTKQQKAESLIKKYLDSTLNDPSSYDPISFSIITNVYGTNEVLHTYRAKNQFGGIIKKSEWFQIDSGFNKVSCCYAGPK